MKHFWHFFILALLATACADNSSADKETPAKPDPVITPDPVPVAQTCATMSCAHGCCDDACVDFRSDVAHCGRCDTKCDPGAYCLNGSCVTSCTGNHVKICEGDCVDISTNSSHCGRCNSTCGTNMECSDSRCTCIEGYSDCDGNALNGCESAVDTCECVNGSTASCYWGEEGTEGVGRCRAGTMTCENGSFFYCENFIAPIKEIPGNGIDDDCDGMIDEPIDDDGDGFYYGFGPGMDCCDNRSDCMAENPALVNPNAVEIPGNGIDDDCDGMTDENDDVLCSTEAHVFTANQALTANDAILMARAMDICTDTETAGYGLISAQFLLADGTPLPATGNKSVCGNTTLISPAEQAAVATDLGGVVKALNGTMAVLASGKAQGKENTGFKDCSGTEVDAPSSFINAHDGYLPVSNICFDPAASKHKRANDSIMLRLRLKAPSTAKGFSFLFKFFSKEYPSYVCNNYNDFFLAMTDASSPEIPADRNISFDANHNPVSVNNAFFTECDPTACQKPKGCSSCKDGSDNVQAYVYDVKQAGATDWLKTTVPVNGAEEFTLDLIIFDAGDRDASKGNGWGHQRDSLVLIDNFEWLTEATTLQTIVN